MGKILNSSTLGRKLLWSDRMDASWKECGHTHIHTFTSLCCGIRIQTVKLLWQEADVSWLPVCLSSRGVTQFILEDIKCPCTEYCIYLSYEVIGVDIVAWVWSSCSWLWTCRRHTQGNPQVLAALALRLCCLISVAVRIKRWAVWDWVDVVWVSVEMCVADLVGCVWRCVCLRVVLRTDWKKKDFSD